MTYNPKGNEEKIRRVLDGFERLAPTKTFGGMTLAQFKEGVAPSLDTRQQLAELDTHRDELQARREQADAASLPLVQRIVAGVLADPEFGPDSPLYESFGYIRESEQKSGLTHKSTKKTDKPTEK